MLFKISKTLSNGEWAKISKPELWRRLAQGITAGAGGVTEAVNEVYAIVTKSVDGQLTADDALFPHHEIRDDGAVVLNQAGLAEAAAALASDETLTEAQRERARRHLLRHYRELEMDPPETLAGEMASLVARVAGEMRPEDVPLASGVDLATLKADDDDPMEVVVEVPTGRSTRGWNYRDQALKDIVNAVNGETLPGYLGHQKVEEVSTQFPTPVTHWVGAVWRDGKAYFRGVIDKSAGDLKRWIRAKRVKQVSIFGASRLKQVGGEVHVVGYKPFSIDWTPLNRAGMPTRIVAVGEMDSTFGWDRLEGELDDSFDELRQAIEAAAQKELGGGDDGYTYVLRHFPEYVIVEHSKRGSTERKLYRYDYRRVGDEVTLSNRTEVEEKREYLPTGEMDEPKEDDEDMTLAEMLAAIRSAIAKGETDFTKVLGEIGVTKEQAIETLAGEQLRVLRTGSEYGAKLAAALGFNKDMNTEVALALAGEMAGVCKAIGLVPGADVAAAKSALEAYQATWKALGFDQSTPEKPAEVAGEMAKAYGEQQTSAHSQLVEACIAKKVSGEQAQGLIKRMLRVADGATEEQITGEIDQLLNDDVVKGLIGANFVDQSAGTGGSGSTEPKDQPKKHLRAKRVAV